MASNPGYFGKTRAVGSRTTGGSHINCFGYHYAQLIDVNGDGRIDFLCPDQTLFPQKIYDTRTFPWMTLFDSSAPNSLFPGRPQVVDSIIADFNNDGLMDMFLLGGVQLRASSVVQGGSCRGGSAAGQWQQRIQFRERGLGHLQDRLEQGGRGRHRSISPRSKSDRAARTQPLFPSRSIQRIQRWPACPRLPPVSPIYPQCRLASTKRPISGRW